MVHVLIIDNNVKKSLIFNVMLKLPFYVLILVVKIILINVKTLKINVHKDLLDVKIIHVELIINYVLINYVQIMLNINVKMECVYKNKNNVILIKVVHIINLSNVNKMEYVFKIKQNVNNYNN